MAMEVQISGETEALIAKLIASGDYPTTEAVIDAALQQLDAALEQYLEKVQAAVAQGQDDMRNGRFVRLTPTVVEEIIAEALTTERSVGA